MSDSTAWESAVTSAEYVVHHGTWTNWSRGRIMGATLTLSRTDGNYLLAFTAFFISMVAARFWRILCFIAHNKFSTPEPRDAVHHQRQAILRNSASAPSSLWTILLLVWTWRGVADRLLVRALPVILTAVLCAAAFTVAGGFSSQLSTGISNEVLLDGSRCGIVDTSGNVNGSGGAVVSYRTNGLFNAANYAQQCYSVNVSRAFDCTTFVQPTIPSSINHNAPCPFDQGICRSNDSNIHLDTGYIDSRKFLGINAPRSERILFRNTLQCAPLVTRDYSDNLTLPSGNFTRYYYGGSPLRQDQNFTYQAPDLNSQYPNVSYHTKVRGRNLQLAEIHAFHLNGSVTRASDFNPIPELSRDDGDLTIVFLMGNGAQYTERTTDPWYRATVPVGTWRFNSAPASAARVTYSPEEAASPLGCLQQFQICNVDENHCGPLASFYDYQSQSASVFNITEEDRDNSGLFVEDNPLGQRFQWFTGIMAYGASIDIAKGLRHLGAYTLSSQSAMEEGFMGSLAENQWQVDVEHWWATGLASMQSGMVDVAVGPTEAALQPFTIRPPSSHIQSFCNSQKILTTEFTSFSLFGIYFTYLVGAIIVVISYLLEPVQDFLYRRKKTSEYARLEWATTESLQLQRAAYQGINSGTWTGHLDAVPMTKPDELLGDLPRSYRAVSASSCIGQAQMSVEKLNPAPISRPSTGEASEESNKSTAEDERHCVSSAKQEPVPIVSCHATEQSPDSSPVEDVSEPTVALVSPLTPTLPPKQNIERPELREAYEDSLTR